MNREEVVAKLTPLVAESSRRTETECGDLLATPSAASLLLPFGVHAIFTSAELRTASGDLDLLIGFEERRPGGSVHRCLTIWELKAPQAYLYKIETKSRACPSPDLLAAENQLMHYHAHVRDDETTRRQFSITHRDDVRIGGIVMGRSDTFVQATGAMSVDDARRLAGVCRDIRQDAFYGQLRLNTWDDIIFQLNISTASHYSIPAPGSSDIHPSEGPPISGSIDS
jgi:hypothetical protein